MKKIRRVIVALLLIIALEGCGNSANDNIVESSMEEQSSTEEQTFFVTPRPVTATPLPAETYSRDWEHGSCKNIWDRTIITSVFLSDTNYSWDETSESDSNNAEYELNNLTIATEWITNAVAEYDVSVDFVYNWVDNPDLKYNLSVDADVSNTEDENVIWKVIDENIDSEALLKKYNAENILFVIYQNVPKNWDLTSMTWVYEGDKYPYEYCIMYPFYKGKRVGPASYAHEILHAYGAHDLYIGDENDTYVATEEYVNYLKNTGSIDIMYSVSNGGSDITSETIVNELSEIDAYYIGITSRPPEIEEYGLDKSDYDTK